MTTKDFSVKKFFWVPIRILCFFLGGGVSGGERQRGKDKEDGRVRVSY